MKLWSVYIPTLMRFGKWMKERRSQIQASKMSFLRRVSGLIVSDWVRRSVIWAELRVQLLLLSFQRSQLKGVQAFDKDVFWVTPFRGFLGVSHSKRPQGRPKTYWRSEKGWLSFLFQPVASVSGLPMTGKRKKKCWPIKFSFFQLRQHFNFISKLF